VGRKFNVKFINQYIFSLKKSLTQLTTTVLKTSVAEIKLLDDDFIRVEYRAGSYIDLGELEESVRAYRELVGNFKFYIITIANPNIIVSQRARNYWVTPKRSTIKIAEAFVIRDMAHRLIANFIVKFQPPKHTLKFFSAEQKAAEWIELIRKKGKK
jgi:hypothetical protein